jgi:hypothetical protein
MGWGSGSSLFSKIIDAAKEAIPNKKKRVVFYESTISAFEDEDWDTENECLGSDVAFDEALKKLHPDWEIFKEE